MLLPTVIVKASPIHGVGLFATQDIPRGSVVWHPCRQCEVWTSEEAACLSKLHFQFLDEYGYCLVDGGRLLPCSNAYLMNHACNAAVLDFGLDFGIAVRDIKSGEEITCDYRTFLSDPSWHVQCACGDHNCAGEFSSLDGRSVALQRHWRGQLTDTVCRIPEVPQPLEDGLIDCSSTYRYLQGGVSEYVFKQATSIRNPEFLKKSQNTH